jgi:ADP-ribose pyrophosphatase
MNMSDAVIIDSIDVYRGYCCLKKITFKHRLFSGAWSQPIVREVLERGNAIAVLLIDPRQDQLVLVEQIRISLHTRHHAPWLLEIVAGIRHTDEAETEVAQRETLEETSLVLLNLEPIYTYWSSPGVSTEQVSLFCGHVDATSVQNQSVHGLISEGEDIRVHIVKINEAIGLLESGHINNAMTIIAIQWLEKNYTQLKRRWLV